MGSTGLIIANFQDNEKSLCKVGIYVGPPTFFLARQWPPTFLILEPPLLILYKSQVHSYSVMQWWACSSLMSLLCLQRQVGKVASGLFYCWSFLRNNTVATNPQRFTIHFGRRRFVICCMRLLNVDILASNAARQWHADSGKPRTFVLCEKKHEWVYSNASTSLKNPLLVRVLPICLSVKLHLSRLLFMQCKNTWLVRICLCRLVGIRLNY